MRKISLIFIFAIVFGCASSASAINFVVNNTLLDTLDNAPGDGTCADVGGFCTLRAAIASASRGRETPGSAAGNPAICSSPCTSRRIRCTGARVTTCISSCRLPYMRRRLGRASTSRRLKAARACACRPARSRGSGSGCASVACSPCATAAGAISWSRCG